MFLLYDIEDYNLNKFKRCFDLFDGNDTSSVAKARLRWKKRKAAGYMLTYWQQSNDGKWQEKNKN